MAERTLTERSKERIAAGETEGAGTNICVKCKAAKEESRVNSDRCLACNGRKSGKTAAKGRPELVRGVSVDIPNDLFNLLVTLSADEGMPIKTYASRVLADHLKDQQFPVLPEPEPEPEPAPEITTAQWKAVTQWVRDDPTRLSPDYTGGRNWKEPASRAEFYAWALTQGFTP